MIFRIGIYRNTTRKAFGMTNGLGVIGLHLGPVYLSFARMEKS